MGKFKSIEERFWPKVLKTDSCWWWIGAKSRFGYGWLGFKPKNGHKMAHRISWEIHNGPIAEGMCICHSCDNRLCVNPFHLWIGTKADNNRDCKIKGRTYKGPRPWMYKPRTKRGPAPAP